MATLDDLAGLNQQSSGVQNLLDNWPKLPEKIRAIDPDGCQKYEAQIVETLKRWMFNLNKTT